MSLNLSTLIVSALVAAAVVVAFVAWRRKPASACGDCRLKAFCRKK